MQIRKLGLFIGVSLCSSMSAFGVTLPPAPLVEDFSGSLLSPYYEATIGSSGLVLMEDTTIRIESLIIEGTLETQGHQLIIDTRRLEFRQGGRIIGFGSAMDQNRHRGSCGPLGPRGRKEHVRMEVPKEVKNNPALAPLIPLIKKIKAGEKGGDGVCGQDGPEGFRGMANPGAIVIFASEVIGVPVIEGVGQRGGKGGQGGQGGQGGEGGHGSAAYKSFWKTQPAGAGGDSGRRGYGGRGGEGGQGGDAIPVVFLTSKGQVDTSRILSQPGLGGEGGDEGPAGDPGKPGKGGREDKACFIWVLSEKKGKDGKKDQTVVCRPDPGTGPLGRSGNPVDRGHPILSRFLSAESSLASAPVIERFHSLEERRGQVGKDWQAFHWARTLKLLVWESLNYLNSTSQILEDFGDLDFFRPDLNIVFEQRRAELLAQWENHLLNPLQNTQRSESAIFREQILAVARPLVEALRALGEANQREVSLARLREAFRQVDAFLQTTIQTATASCQNYLQNLAENQTRLSPYSVHFEIPVCLGNPDMTLPQNTDQEFVVFTTYPLVVPEGVSYRQVVPGDAPHVARTGLRRTLLYATVLFERLFSIPSSFAGLDDLIAFDQVVVEATRKKVLLLESPQAVDYSIRGYRKVSTKEAQEKRAFHLRALSIFGGESCASGN